MKEKMNLTACYADNKGFSLVELMIALSVGLLLFAGVLTVFVGMKTTTAETSSYGELQENGRFAVSVLTEDLLRQSFWGDLSGTLNQANITVTPIVAGTALNINNDCVGGGVNNASLPQAIGSFRTLWGLTIAANSLNPLGCFGAVANTQTRLNSDVIQFKRVISQPVALANLNADDIYLYANLVAGKIFSNNVVPPLIANGRYWQYQHHVYYVRERTVGNNTVPMLMQGRLANRRMDFTPIIDGIEMIRFMYGVDINGDGNVDSYLNADNVPESAWDNTNNSSILAVKVFVLARNIMPDRKYTNTKTYQLGDLSFPVNDNYRRLLFSSTVTLYNANVTSWQ
jgi:type IV pilus assembly protein PilW